MFCLEHSSLKEYQYKIHPLRIPHLLILFKILDMCFSPVSLENSSQEHHPFVILLSLITSSYVWKIHSLVPVGQSHHNVKSSQKQHEMVKGITISHLVLFVIVHLLLVPLFHQVYITSPSCFIVEGCAFRGTWRTWSCRHAKFSYLWAACCPDACIYHHEKHHHNANDSLIVHTFHWRVSCHKGVTWKIWNKGRSPVSKIE